MDQELSKVIAEEKYMLGRDNSCSVVIESSGIITSPLVTGSVDCHPSRLWSPHIPLPANLAETKSLEAIRLQYAKHIFDLSDPY